MYAHPSQRPKKCLRLNSSSTKNGCNHTNQQNPTKAAPKVYTGTNMLGIATMHKSNAVPVFNSESAVEISNMRR